MGTKTKQARRAYKKRKKERDRIKALHKQERQVRVEGESDEEYAKRMKMCGSKARFPTKQAALGKAARIRSGDNLSWYHCPHCGGWHLTHKGKYF